MKRLGRDHLRALAAATARIGTLWPSSGFAGVGYKRPGTWAELYVGLRVDELAPVVGCNTKSGRIGSAIQKRRKTFSVGAVLDAATAIRAAQIGHDAAGATVSPPAPGSFAGAAQRSTVVRIVAAPGEGPAAFDRRVARAGEQIALRFALKVVMIQGSSGGRTYVRDVSPAGLPAPGAALDRAVARLARTCRRQTRGGTP